MTHSAHLLSPKLIAPKIGTETLSPLLPSCLYSAFGGLELLSAAIVVDLRLEEIARVVVLLTVARLVSGVRCRGLLIVVMYLPLVGGADFQARGGVLKRIICAVDSDSVDVERSFIIINVDYEGLHCF